MNQQRLDSVRFTGYTNALIRHDAGWQTVGPEGQLMSRLFRGARQQLPMRIPFRISSSGIRSN